MIRSLSEVITDFYIVKGLALSLFSFYDIFMVIIRCILL